MMFQFPFRDEAVPEEPSTSSAALFRREQPLYTSANDIRSAFARDYTRILHSNSFRRLKHKTQVFFNGAGNDHICTRIEHVTHVESVANTIGRSLGLNQDLIKAIAMGHDLGHAPFGHLGEQIISNISGQKFWHEKHGLYLTDCLELLPDHEGRYHNLNLTYAVRDGIISHCGEIDQNGIHRRSETFDLQQFDQPGKYQAATWEGCVVKLSDKIAYLGRDIEDAVTLGYLGHQELDELRQLARRHGQSDALNTSSIMHNLITDLCQNSNPEVGLRFSEPANELLNAIKKFNYRYIYGHPRLAPYRNYAELVIQEIFDYLRQLYSDKDTLCQLYARQGRAFKFVEVFRDWLRCYCLPEIALKDQQKFLRENYLNGKIYGDLSNKRDYKQAVTDFIAGMTDPFACKSFQELLEN